MLYDEYVNQIIARDRGAEYQRAARRRSARPSVVVERRRRGRSKAVM